MLLRKKNLPRNAKKKTFLNVFCLGNRYSALEVHLGHLDDEFHFGIAAVLLHLFQKFHFEYLFTWQLDRRRCRSFAVSMVDAVNIARFKHWNTLIWSWLLKVHAKDRNQETHKLWYTSLNHTNSFFLAETLSHIPAVEFFFCHRGRSCLRGDSSAARQRYQVNALVT